MKLLIVEDEKKTGEYLTKGLTEAGFVVDLADNGLNGYHLATVSYTHLTLPTTCRGCRSRWSPYH